MEKDMKIILASGSPRRREILEKQGLKLTIVTSDKEEKITKSNPKDVVLGLSEMKTTDVYERVSRTEKGEYMVIGADTVVAAGGRILGKPKSREDAFNMIKLLSGNKHSVFTGVCIKVVRNNKCETLNFVEETEVFVKTMDDEEILRYTDTGEPMDKAGAYGIQGLFAPFVEKINGDYYNVMGLPLARIYTELKKIKINLA